jgi:PTS system nitrogen regulatory IIA component
MQLTIPEAAQLLQVTEDTVYRWIRERGLPASQFGGRYHFNKMWLMEWAHDKGIPVAAEAGAELPILAEALSRGGVHTNIPGGNAAEALRAAVDRLDLPEDVDRAYLHGMLMLRERQGSTGFGRGIAIPHTREPILLHVPEPLAAVCYLERPIDFAAADGKPVSVLFVLVTPTIGVHLHLLSQIGRALLDAAFAEAVLGGAGLPELLERLHAIGAGVSSVRASA